jgi:Tfp pilus assembly protein PilN
MRVINFLPDDYRQRISARRANLVCGLIAGGALVALAATVALTYVQATGTAGLRTIVERQYDEANRQVAQAQELEDRKGGLLHKVELSTALLDRVPSSRMLAILSNYLPTGVSLTNLSMRSEDIEVKAAKPADAKKPAAVDTSKQSAFKKAPDGPQATRIKRVVFRVDGLAETDVEVARYLTSLSADPLFEEVDLQFTEEFPYADGVTMRRFQMVFRLSPNAPQIMDMSLAQK